MPERDVSDAVCMYGSCQDCDWTSPVWHDEEGLISSWIRDLCREHHTPGHAIKFSECYYEGSRLVPRIRHVLVDGDGKTVTIGEGKGYEHNYSRSTGSA